MGPKSPSKIIVDCMILRGIERSSDLFGMNTNSQSPLEQIRIARHLLRWSLLVLPVAVAVGAFVALFLWLLETATQLRHANMWLIYLLPLAGGGSTLCIASGVKIQRRGII